jgi:hypothetical protein
MPPASTRPRIVDLGLTIDSVEDVAADDRATVLEHILAHIVFPDDEEDSAFLGRRGYLLTLAAERLFELEDQGKAPAERLDQQRKRVEDLGGLRRLIDCQALEHYRGLPGLGRHLFAVGHLTLLMARMEAAGVEKGGASVSKAIHLVSQSAGSPKMLRNTNTLQRAWAKRRAVAHLCAAYIGMAVKWKLEQSGGETCAQFVADRLPQLVAMALSLQHYLTGKSSHSRTEVLVSADHIWRLPDIPGLAPAPIPELPLPPWAQAVVDEYRVRSR